MSEGLATTLKVLTRTDNEAVLPVLLLALDSPHRPIRQGALRAILQRRAGPGSAEIVRRLEQLEEPERQIVLEFPGRLTSALRDAILGTDLDLCSRACRAAVWGREYDLIPALLTAVEDTSHRNGQIACDAMMKLVHALYDELAEPGDRGSRRDPQLTRRHVISAMELSIRRFSRHHKRAVVEAFLLLVNRDNVTLKSLLQNPLDPAFLVVSDVLNKEEHGGIIRLLLSFLDDLHAPSAALTIAANRADLRFLRFFLRKVGRAPSTAVSQNLKRIESITWLRHDLKLVDQLDDTCQQGAVGLVMSAGVSRTLAFSLVEHVLRHGKPGGRREAARALAEFHGADANTLAMNVLDDPDPHVQAALVAQLRHRGIPGALARMVEFIDSQHPVVRQVARENLAEFTFTRYLGAFDMLDEEVRRSTGQMVRKIDAKTVPSLRLELQSPVRSRRLRGIAMARSMDLVETMETEVIGLLEDEDHLVRAEAATSLAQTRSPDAHAALEVAQGDRSTVVREAAQTALQQRAVFDQWRAVLSDPRD